MHRLGASACWLSKTTRPNSSVFVSFLGYDDIDVSVVDTGKEALAAVTEASYDCVVLDLRLPDMTGFDVLESLARYSLCVRLAGGGVHG